MDNLTSGVELVRVEDIAKRFGGVTALDRISLSIRKGEIHALVGENGAGKSTLMKILAGVYQPDEGRIFFKGQEEHFENPRAARARGVSIVFQELNLFPELTVAGNIFVNAEPTTMLGLMDEKYMLRRSREVLELMEIQIDPRKRVKDLPLGEQQMVEIAGALEKVSELIIMDEPNSALTDRETEALFAILRRLRDGGITVIYVSHRLEEVFSIADRISVLRDGHYMGTKLIQETDIPEVISMMTGRTLTEVYPQRKPLPEASEVLIEIKGLTRKEALASLDFEIHAGEIFGIVGLEGCGKEVLYKILFGLDTRDGGQVTYQGKPVEVEKPWEAIKLEWAMIPADRRHEGAILDWSILNNGSLVILDELANRFGLVNRRKARNTMDEFVEMLNIVTDSLNKPVNKLSGGNQQKVVLSKWLATGPKFLLLNDPTRGIDVGSKAEIYSLIHKLAERGLAILFTSSELDEVLGLCDRSIVLYRGRKVLDFQRGEATKQEVLYYINGGGRSA